RATAVAIPGLPPRLAPAIITGHSRSCAPAGPGSRRACIPRRRTNHAAVSLAFQGRIEGNDGEDPTSCSGLRQRLLRRPRTRVAALALLISARRSDTGSVTLQGTRSSGHAPGHRCARFGPFGTRQLVQPAELRLAAFRCP